MICVEVPQSIFSPKSKLFFFRVDDCVRYNLTQTSFDKLSIFHTNLA